MKKWIGALDGHPQEPSQISSCEGIAIKEATRIARAAPSTDVEDLVQAGRLGLVLADARFDSSRGVKFSTYATYWVKKEILDATEQATKHSAATVSLDTITLLLTSDGDHNGDFQDERAPNPHANSVLDEQRAAVRGFLNSLPTRQRQVMIARYYEGMTKAATARTLGITPGRVSHVESAVLGKGRRALRRFAPTAGLHT